MRLTYFERRRVDYAFEDALWASWGGDNRHAFGLLAGLIRFTLEDDFVKEQRMAEAEEQATATTAAEECD